MKNSRSLISLAALAVLLAGCAGINMKAEKVSPLPSGIRHIDFMSKMLRVPAHVPQTEPAPESSTDHSCALANGVDPEGIRTPTIEWINPEVVLNNCLMKIDATGEACCGTVIADAIMQCVEMEEKIIQGTAADSFPQTLLRICTNPTLENYRREIQRNSQKR